PLEREEGLHVRQVDPERIADDAALLELAMDARSECIWDACLARHRAAHRRHARLPARLREPWGVKPVVLRSGAEVPQHRVALAREEDAARAFVAGPLADVRARDIADVVLVEEEHRSEIGLPQGGPGSLEAVGAELREVDPLLPVDGHGRP